MRFLPDRYISSIRPEAYPKVLRNLVIGATIVNVPILLLTYAVLPRESIMSGANILSLVGERAAGSWLRIVIVIDSAVVVSHWLYVVGRAYLS